MKFQSDGMLEEMLNASSFELVDEQLHMFAMLCIDSEKGCAPCRCYSCPTSFDDIEYIRMKRTVTIT